VTASGVVGAAAVIVAFGGAALLLVPVVRRRRLGVLHPAVAWLALEGVFFGVGSIALALADDRSGPGLFLAGCVIATAVALVGFVLVFNSAAVILRMRLRARKKW